MKSDARRGRSALGAGRDDVQPDGGHQNDALGDLLPECVDAEHGHAVVEAGHDHRADQRADHRTDAAAHRRAADEAGGDGVEFAAEAGRRRTRRQARGGGHAGEGAHQAHQAPDQHLDQVDVDARQSGRLEVGADRIDAAAEHRPVADDGEDAQNDQQNQDRHRHALIGIQRHDEAGDHCAGDGEL